MGFSFFSGPFLFVLVQYGSDMRFVPGLQDFFRGGEGGAHAFRFVIAGLFRLTLPSARTHTYTHTLLYLLASPWPVAVGQGHRPWFHIPLCPCPYDLGMIRTDSKRFTTASVYVNSNVSLPSQPTLAPPARCTALGFPHRMSLSLSFSFSPRLAADGWRSLEMRARTGDAQPVARFLISPSAANGDEIEMKLKLEWTRRMRATFFSCNCT